MYEPQKSIIKEWTLELKCLPMLTPQAQPQRPHVNVVIFSTLIHINIMLITQTPRTIYYYYFTCFFYFNSKGILSDQFLKISHSNSLPLLSHFSFYLEQDTNNFRKWVMRAKTSRMIEHGFSNQTSSKILHRTYYMLFFLPGCNYMFCLVPLQLLL